MVESEEPGLAAKLDLDSMLRSMETVCKSIRDMRNRTIAHRDWGRRAEATPVTNKKEIDEALDLAAKIMNAVELHYQKSETNYHPLLEIFELESIWKGGPAAEGPPEVRPIPKASQTRR